jgi:hypothetical protein
LQHRSRGLARGIDHHHFKGVLAAVDVERLSGLPGKREGAWRPLRKKRGNDIQPRSLKNAFDFPAVYRFGTLAPKQWEGLKVLNLPEPEIAEKVGPVRLTEPDHSSDPGLMTTRAEKECS